MNHRFCDPYDLCSNNGTSLAEKSIIYRHTHHCMCDEMCSQLKDCCNTSIYYNQQEQKEPISFTCHSFKSCRHQLFIKNTCAKSWKNEEIAWKCSTSSNEKLMPDNLDITTPVSSPTTNITYRNVYCALCNFEENYLHWKIIIICQKEEPLFSSGTREIGVDLDLLVNISKCQLAPQIPPNIAPMYCKNVKIIDSCPDTWTDKRTMELCEQFYFLVRESNNEKRGLLYYRNKYCAYCNGVADSKLQCIFTMKTRTAFNEIYVPEMESDSNGIKAFFDWYTMVALCCSLFFLICHLIVFTFVRRMQNLGGKNLASFCLALILVYGNFLAGDFVQGSMCVMVAIFTYYSFLVAFACMLTMSFDVWKTFWNTTRKLRAVPQKQNLRFSMYSICNWLLPVLPVLFAVYLQFYDTDSALSPKFGKESCWLGSSSILIFFSLPSFLIILTNFAFFIHTLYMIRSNQCNSANQKNLVDFRLYARLALFTGSTWIVGIFLTYFPYVWIKFLFTFLNATQGVFIFIAFTCKKKHFVEFLIRVGILEKSDLTSRTSGFTLDTTSGSRNSNVSRERISSR